MLTRLRLQDFKSFADQEIALSPMTLLVGANASGKSNVLDAIRFLQGLALGFSVEQALNGRTEGGNQIWPGIRGGTAEVARGRRERFQLQCHWTGDAVALDYEGEIGLDKAPRTIREKLGGPGGAVIASPVPPPRFTAVDASGRERLYEVYGGPQYSVLQQHAEGWFEGYKKFEHALAGVTLLDLRPEQMRHHVPKVRASIGSSGADVSAAVWQLAQEPERKEDLIRWLSELCSPQIVDLEFDVTTLLEEVMLVLVEADGTKVSARALSDGTLRFLGTLVALLTMAPGDTLLIEEIESGLHPTRVHLLIDLAEEVTRDGRCQVIASTHSAAALLSLSSPGLRNAIVFGRVPGQAGTVARRLGDLPNFDDVEARSGIDDMFTSRWLEQSL